jgi:hypothetical protein
MTKKQADSQKDIQYSIWETKTNEFPEFPIQKGEMSIESAELEPDLKDKNGSNTTL